MGISEKPGSPKGRASDPLFVAGCGSVLKESHKRAQAESNRVVMLWRFKKSPDQARHYRNLREVSQHCKLTLEVPIRELVCKTTGKYAGGIHLEWRRAISYEIELSF